MNAKYLIITISYFLIVNLLLTFTITTSLFNTYIDSFQLSFYQYLNSIVGNLTILTIIVILVFTFSKKAHNRTLILGIISIVLVIILYALKIYTRYYQAFFSFRTLSVFKNPAVSLGLSIVFESVKEFFTTFTFLYLIFGIGLIIYSIYLRKLNIDYSLNDLMKSLKLRLGSGILMILVSFLSILGFQSTAKKEWPFNSDIPLYGVQTAGVYNYYFYELLGTDFRYDYSTFLNADELAVYYDTYNKQGTNYNDLFKNDYNDTGKGLFEGKNLYILQLESVNSFLLDVDEVNGIEIMPNFKSILENNNNIYNFTNFHTNSGQGVTADAELALLTGIMPNGATTLHWDYEDTKYEFDALPYLFKEKNYTSFSLHGDTEEFYNRTSVHEELFGFDRYYSIEDYLLTHESNEKDPNSYFGDWVKDDKMIDWSFELIENTTEPYFVYDIMTVSHTPYINNPYEEDYDWDLDYSILERYLSYMQYVDSYLKTFFEKTKDMDDTVFILMGDHGCGISDGKLESILGELNYLETLNTLSTVPALIYDPSGDLTEYMGSLNMTQPLLRSQVDLYVTITKLFNLNTNYQFGINGLGKDKTFTYTPIGFYIITDDFIYSTKNNNKELFNDKKLTKEELNYIWNYRLLIDSYTQGNKFKEHIK